MARTRVLGLTLLALLCFAGNSVLCRLALRHTSIDAATFTLVRIVSGAICLAVLTRLSSWGVLWAGSWRSALALFVYAAAFSFAYVQIEAGSGALLLFGAVQVTMIGLGIRAGERLNIAQTVGFVLAIGGLVGLLAPGRAAAPPVVAAALMLTAGAAWGVYSLRGKGAGNPAQTTAANFVLAVPMAIVLSLCCSQQATGPQVSWQQTSWDQRGLVYAVASGAVTSGIGYTLWYTALPGLKATEAAAVQLSVPVLVMVGGILLLNESLTTEGLLASGAILGGIGLVLFGKRSG